MTRHTLTIAMAALIGCTTNERVATQGERPRAAREIPCDGGVERHATSHDASVLLDRAAANAFHVQSATTGLRPRLAASGNGACLRSTRGSVVCWDLDVPAWQPCASPGCTLDGGLSAITLTGLPAAAVDVSVADWGACVVLDDASVWCWRHPRSGPWGQPRPSRIPVAEATSVTCTPRVVYAIALDGAVWAWGVPPQEGDPPGNFALQLRQEDDAHLDLPARVQGLHDVRQVAGDRLHACALATDGTVACWGTSKYGSVGDVPDGLIAVPQPVAGLSHVAAIGAGADGRGDERSCALIHGGSVVCWGALRFHAPGLREASIWPVPGESLRLIVLWSPKPVAVPGIERAVSLSSDYELDCAIDDQRVARCWGELMPYSTVPDALPVSRAQEVTSRYACVLDEAGGVTCLGRRRRDWLGQRLLPP